MHPRQYLKARRPERFSDSVVVEERPLDRSMLEYQLETLTNRGQEGDFEQFSRALAEREICPNLIPHTGPTGGGDSKVDSETYPVAEALALTWFVGEGKEAASERWAFAFSAKKDWRGKVKSDVAKIVATKRGYVKAFFVTNQFVPDKTRAAVEDELRGQHLIDVRILDRTWILERVYAGRHETLAIEKLHLQISARTQTIKGPFDVRREKELSEVDNHINELVAAGQLDSFLVEDLLESALIARGLERTRAEVEGRFGRARDAAAKYGTPHQRIIIAYQEAFGAFWWYEDYQSYLQKLTAFEAVATTTDNIYHLELATTLWMLLWTAADLAKMKEAESQVNERAERLLALLNVFTTKEEQPSAALQAEMLMLQIRLLSAPKGQWTDFLVALRKVIERSEGLLGFPLSSFIEVISEIGGVFGDLDAFHQLYETAISIACKRSGELTAARMLLSRGAQLLDSEKPYDAIRSIGRALSNLFKEESQDDLVKALYLLGAAYEKVGLLWAARGSMLHAASVATRDLWQNGDVTAVQLACYDRLRWIELRLGRLPHCFSWHEVTLVIKGVLEKRGFDPERLARGDRDFDACVSILLLKTPHARLPSLSRVVATLDSLALYWASSAARFLLGHEDAVAKEMVIDGEPHADLNKLFSMLATQPAADDLPKSASFYSDGSVILESKILGCSITLTADNASPGIELAESVLAALESILATGLSGSTNAIARVPAMTISVSHVASAKLPFDFEAHDREGTPHLEVRVANWNPHKLSLKEQHALRDKLAECVAYLMANAFIFQDHENTLLALIRDERGMDRAINFTGSAIVVSNVLGDKPKQTLQPWLAPEDQAVSVVRTQPWSTDIPEEPAVDKPDEPAGHTSKSGEDDADPILKRDLTNVKHSEIRSVSLIRTSLWDEAKWFATMFLTMEHDADIPALALTFRSGEAAKKIFAAWRTELGPTDKRGLLRISIIRGISIANPHAYKVVVGSNVKESVAVDKAPKLVVAVSRFQCMGPPTSDNLNRFLNSYKRRWAYAFFPAVAPHGVEDPANAQLLTEYAIRKTELNIFDAWQVGNQHMESVAILETDDVIIPPDHQKDAPVLEMLRIRKQREI